MKKSFTLLTALLALSLSARAATVTWEQSDINFYINWDNGYSNHDSETVKDVTVTTGGGNTDYCQFGYSNLDGYPSFHINDGGTLTFSSSLGNLSGIVISIGEGYSNFDNLETSTGWSWDSSTRQLTWKGNAAAAVMTGKSSSGFVDSGAITSIVFTLAAEEPAPADPSLTTITWDDTDLETLNISMSSGGKYMKDIIVKAAYEDVYEDYVNFMYQGEPANYCGFSMNNNGSLTFTPVSGTLTSIVINWNYEGPDPDLVPGSGWIFSNSALTWTSDDEDGAASVVLKSNSDAYLASGPISSIVFTVKDAAAPVDNPVTWTTPMVEIVNLYQSGGNSYNPLSVEMKGVTASVWAVEYGDYAHFMTSVDGINISVSNGGTLTFSSASEEFSSIVIHTNNGDGYGGSDGWVWDSEEATLTWSGEATNAVELANSYVTQITSIVFTFGSEEPVEPDTREVPELRFYNSLTEATIVQDIHGWNFEPGTDYEPPTSYSIFVKDGVFYYQDQVYDNWVAPSQLELDLPITYSLSNNDVIELTSTSGDEFSFNVKEGGYGDVVVTASTVGNTRFQPASITFTIHVVLGKGAERECVLKFIGGPNAGQFVPEDYKFELETGEEFPWTWFELREKNNTEAVYAPSTTIWGSKKYYVASLNGELKLRALTAGDDMFTVRYSRYPDGDVNGDFQVIEFPVHIKPSQPALVSDVDLSSSPAGNPNLVFNAEYDLASHEARLAGALTNEQVRAAMSLWAYGTPGWQAALPNTISFELPAGQGSFNITCAAQDGYEVRVLKFGDLAAECFDNASMETHTITYNLTSQKVVVIYVAEKSSPNNGPKRAPAVKQDAPLASFSTLVVAPTYPVTAKQDPDHSGVYYSTFFNETQKYRLPVGTDAYVATISGEDMNLTKVVDGGDVIPANTALILRSNSASVVLTPTDDAAVTVSVPNLLQGTDSEKAAPSNCYVLSGHSTDYSVTGVGFYAFHGTLPAHKAYLVYSGPSLAPQHRMRFIFNNENATTGIDNATDAVKSEKRIENGQLVIIKNGVRYNAQGQIVK